MQEVSCHSQLVSFQSRVVQWVKALAILDSEINVRYFCEDLNDAFEVCGDGIMQGGVAI